MTVPKRTNSEGPNLSLVSDLAPLYDLGRKPETTAERVRRLQAEARILAREQVDALSRQMGAVIATATEIAKGGEAYPVGIREQAERLVSDMEAKMQGMRAIMDRTVEPKL
jgi:hypothetical protein